MTTLTDNPSIRKVYARSKYNPERALTVTAVIRDGKLKGVTIRDTRNSSDYNVDLEPSAYWILCDMFPLLEKKIEQAVRRGISACRSRLGRKLPS